MPAPSLLFIVGGLLIVSWALRTAGFKPSFRVSSVPAGIVIRPLVYTMMEDIVAVDGHGGQQWRQDLNARYEASIDFRKMVDRLNIFWGFGAFILAIILTIVVFTTPKSIGYGIGKPDRYTIKYWPLTNVTAWVVPFIWAGIWTCITILYAQSCLTQEKITWLGGSSPTVFTFYRLLTSCDLVCATPAARRSVCLRAHHLQTILLSTTSLRRFESDYPLLYQRTHVCYFELYVIDFDDYVRIWTTGIVMWLPLIAENDEK